MLVAVSGNRIVGTGRGVRVGTDGYRRIPGDDELVHVAKPAAA